MYGMIPQLHMAVIRLPALKSASWRFFIWHKKGSRGQSYGGAKILFDWNEGLKTWK